MNYTHLTQAERYQIAILSKAGHEQSEIAQVMNRHPSTISRELCRNRGRRGYRAKQAQEFACQGRLGYDTTVRRNTSKAYPHPVAALRPWPAADHRNHAVSFDHLRPASPLLTAMAMALFCPIRTTSLRPRVTPV